jgi:hypothetical protein
MVARGSRVKRRRLFARGLRVFYRPDVRNLSPARRLVSDRNSLCIVAGAALLSLSITDVVMGQTSGTRHLAESGNVKVEATSSSAGATLVFTPKSQQDTAAVASLETYGKVLAERLPRGDMEVLFPMLPASAELAERLKEHPPAFVVSNDGPAVRVQLIASGESSRAAIHDFVRPVLTSTAKPSGNHPGNNLGWDAPPPPDPGK